MKKDQEGQHNTKRNKVKVRPSRYVLVRWNVAILKSLNEMDTGFYVVSAVLPLYVFHFDIMYVSDATLRLGQDFIDFFRLQNLPLPTERYTSEFDELDKLGRGGFGAVYQCRNKLDGHVYAVKKVPLSSQRHWHRRLRKVLREVKVLALLDHPRIVRYYHAWLEWNVSKNARPTGYAKGNPNVLLLAQSKRNADGNGNTDGGEFNFNLPPMHTDTGAGSGNDHGHGDGKQSWVPLANMDTEERYQNQSQYQYNKGHDTTTASPSRSTIGDGGGQYVTFGDGDDESTTPSDSGSTE